MTVKTHLYHDIPVPAPSEHLGRRHTPAPRVNTVPGLHEYSD